MNVFNEKKLDWFDHLHSNRDTLSVAENFMKILRSQNVSQRGLSKKSENKRRMLNVKIELENSF